MSNTIAHRPHVHHHHIPLLPVLAVIAAIAVAAVVLWAVNQPEPVTITTTGGEILSAPLVQPAAVAAPESPVFRHELQRLQQTGQLNRAYLYGRLHQVDAAGLEPVGTSPSGSGSYEAFDNLR